jgi:insertion element IS1 protein InsB
VLERESDPSRTVDLVKVEEVEADEMWSFVGNKQNQRWLWHAIDHETGEVLAYVIGQHQDSVLLKLKALLEPFGVSHFFTDGWGGYERHINAKKLSIGKENTQKIERKHLTLRTRIKRLMRKTICFSNLKECIISFLAYSSIYMNLDSS